MKINQKLLQDLQAKSINFDVEKFQKYDKERLQKIQQNSANPNFKIRALSEAQQQEFNQTKTTNFNQFQKTDQFRQTQSSFQKRPSTAHSSQGKNLQITQNEFFMQKEQTIFQRDFNNRLISMITIEALEDYLELQQEYFENQTYIQVRFDCKEDSLQIFGELFPKLTEAKLNNSYIESLRDLGTGMQKLQVLWLGRCGITDLSGINAFPELKELYLNFNYISQLNDIYFNDSIEILDLEANKISNDEQIGILETISNLTNLTLENNPISKDKNYRKKIFSQLTNLKFLDNQQGDCLNENIKEDEQQDFSEIYNIFPDILIDKDEKQQIEKEFIKLDPNDKDILIENIFKYVILYNKDQNIFQYTRQKNNTNDHQGTLNFSEDNFYGNAIKAIKHKKQNEIQEISVIKDFYELYRQLQVKNVKPSNFEEMFKIDEEIIENEDIDQIYEKEEKVVDKPVKQQKYKSPEKLDLGEKKPLQKRKIKINKKEINEQTLDNIDMTTSKIQEPINEPRLKQFNEHEPQYLQQSRLAQTLKASTFDQEIKQHEPNPFQTQPSQNFSQMISNINNQNKPQRNQIQHRFRPNRGISNPGIMQSHQESQKEIEKAQLQYHNLRQSFKNNTLIEMPASLGLDNIKPRIKISLRSQRGNSLYRNDTSQNSEFGSTNVSSQFRTTQEQFNENYDNNDNLYQANEHKFNKFNIQSGQENKKQMDIKVRRFRAMTQVEQKQ